MGTRELGSEGIREFVTSTRWYPSREEAEFGALAIFVGSALVTLGAAVVAVPMGVLAALCLSDILPFSMRQVVKPLIEMLAAIPSVVYGFFALVVFAPLMQERGGGMLAAGALIIFAPLAIIITIVLSDLVTTRFDGRGRIPARIISTAVTGGLSLMGLLEMHAFLSGLAIVSGTNAHNVSIILGIMALPTVVSVSEDAQNAIGRDLREGSYALGATRAETLLRVVVPAARSGISACISPRTLSP